MIRQKDFPKSVRVTDKVSYAVKFKRGLEKRGYMGLCFYNDKEIWISTGLSEADRFSTYWHEIMHALSHEYGFELGHDVINKLERPLAKFLLLNTPQREPEK